MNLIQAIQEKNYADIKSYFRDKYLEKLAARITQKKDEFLANLKK